MGARSQSKIRRADLARVSVPVGAVGTTAMLSTRSMISLPRKFSTPDQVLACRVCARTGSRVCVMQKHTPGRPHPGQMRKSNQTLAKRTCSSCVLKQSKQRPFPPCSSLGRGPPLGRCGVRGPKVFVCLLVGSLSSSVTGRKVCAEL